MTPRRIGEHHRQPSERYRCETRLGRQDRDTWKRETLTSVGSAPTPARVCLHRDAPSIRVRSVGSDAARPSLFYRRSRDLPWRTLTRSACRRRHGRRSYSVVESWSLSVAQRGLATGVVSVHALSARRTVRGRQIDLRALRLAAVADRVVTLPRLGGGVTVRTAAGVTVREVYQATILRTVPAPGRPLHRAHRDPIGADPDIGQPDPVICTR